MDRVDIKLDSPPSGYESHYKAVLTDPAVQFVAELVQCHEAEVQQMFKRRTETKVRLDETKSLPDFCSETEEIRKSKWTIEPLPKRLLCRHVDVGDVSPSNTDHFIAALKSPAQGIQTDFDDGHCPTWANQLLGLFNVILAVDGKLPGVKDISQVPVLMLRPRAWNMVDRHMLVNGKEVPGPLFDFGLLMYHCGKKLYESGSGPFFYLPKLESYHEARLWNNIFIWTEEKMELPRGTIKACVLIENILACFEMEEILYELREHSAGLNCGVWDYSASIVNKFGDRREFMLPDRNKYVNIDRHFLKSYMNLVIKVCHSRKAPATGGMSASVLPSCDKESEAYTSVLQAVCSSKLKEVQAGFDGFMVYDVGLVAATQKLFTDHSAQLNQINVQLSEVNVTAKDLLEVPAGGVTLSGLKHNIAVGIFFILAWLQGKGHYHYNGAVEDSATAEISRSQVWQWIRHKARLEDTGDIITCDMVQKLIQKLVEDHSKDNSTSSGHQIVTAARIFQEIIYNEDFPEFITTYLYQDISFQNEHTGSVQNVQ